MYRYYRRIRTVGRIRAWYAAKVDRVQWDLEDYPPPPEMRYPGIIPILGQFADVRPSYIRINRYSSIRGSLIESEKKVKRLRKRHQARRYRALQKRTGKG